MRTLVFILILITAALATGCTSAAKAGDPALPAGFAERGIPDVDLTAYLVVDAGAPVEISTSAFGDGSGSFATLARLEGAVLSLGLDQAVRLDLTNAPDAASVGGLARGSSAWVEVAGTRVTLGTSEGTWASALRAAWAEGVEPVTVASRYPAVWDVLRLLPADPPARPIAAGFAREIRDSTDALLTLGGIDVPGLGSALGFLRVETLAFGVYAADVAVLPTAPTPEAIKDAGIGIVAVADAEYPGIIIGLLIGGFADRMGLTDTTVAGEDARYRSLPGGLHLLFKNYGATLYFVASDTRQMAEELLGSIIASQR